MMEHSASIPPFIIAKAAAAAEGGRSDGREGGREAGRENEDDGGRHGIMRGCPAGRRRSFGE